MSTALSASRLTADEFMVTPQSRFGNAWRYELVDGVIIAHDAPEADHGAIHAGLIAAIGALAASLPPGCRPEIGSAAIPDTERRNTARIPDAMIRCGGKPLVAFEVISPSELRDWRGRDRKRRDMQAVPGVRELVELAQTEHAVHVYRLQPGGTWSFDSLEGPGSVLRLDSVGLDLPLSDIYRFVTFPDADPAQHSPDDAMRKPG